MPIFEDINKKLGRNNWPPTQEIADRWEWVAYWAGLRDGKEEYVRNEAIKRNMGGRNRDAYVAMPVPYALSKASSNLLFGEAPKIVAANQEDQQRLDLIVHKNKLIAQCRAAAVTSSSEGGVYLKLSVDPSTPVGRQVPRLQFLQEARVIPQFVANELIQATIITSWSEGNGRRVYRLLENHQPGIISYKLYLGSNTDIGSEIGLNSYDKTVNLDPEIETGIDELLVSYIPNSLSVNSPFGVSDYANGIDNLFYQFNDATSIAHRATQAGVPLTMMPRDILDENQNLNHEKTIIAVNKLADTLGEGDLSKMIQTVQHNAQQDKFMSYANEVLDLLLLFSGLSGASFGREDVGNASSGTALKLKMASTLATAASKASFYEDSLSEMLRLAALLDSETVGDGNMIKEGYNWVEADGMISVRLADGLPEDENETSAIIQKLRSAGVISIKEAIRKANPEWTEEQVDQELEDIQGDIGTETAAIGNALAPTQTGVDLVGNLNDLLAE